MKNNLAKVVLITLLLVVSCDAQKVESKMNQGTKTEKKIDSNTKVTFVELGSVNCIPCKQMQPVMKSIDEKYGENIEVIFYDVWKAEQKKYATQYGIKLIPTQVFLDKNGKEFFRHEGFFPETEIDKVLESQGLSPIN